MNACESFCIAVQGALGPTLSNVVLGGLGLALVWWRARKHTAQAVEPLKKELAEIRTSLRPPP
jgi:hypothetical protein